MARCDLLGGLEAGEPRAPLLSLAVCYLRPIHTAGATPHSWPHGEDGRGSLENLVSFFGAGWSVGENIFLPCHKYGQKT